MLLGASVVSLVSHGLFDLSSNSDQNYFLALKFSFLRLILISWLATIVVVALK